MKNLMTINLNRRKRSACLVHCAQTCLLGLLLLLPFVGSGAVPQSKRLSLNMENVSLEKLFQTISEQTGYYFIFNSDQIGVKDNISIRVSNKAVKDVLQQLLPGRGLAYSFDSDIITVFPAPAKAVQQSIKKKVISGKVKDEKGNPLPGVSVFVKGTSFGVATNAKGEFRLEVPEMKDLTLVWRFVGMETVTRTVTDKKENIVLNIKMKEEAKEIEEVVVTGIFNKAKESFTGAATLITKEELQEFKSSNLLRTLGNIDPSFNIVQNNEYGSDPNKLPEINIRGTTSIPSNLEDLQAGERANLNTPLFILDGFEISLERMMDLDPEEIESVTILKDASSTAIYGSRGSNGVVVLTSVKPEAGKLRVSFGGGVNLEIPDLDSYNLLHAGEKLEIERIAGLYKGETIEEELKLRDLYSQKLQKVLEGVDTYWLNKPLRTGVGQNYRLSLGGGDPAFRYNLSVSYRNTAAVMKGSYRNNFNGSLTINYFKDKLSFSNNVSVGINKSANSPYGSFSQYVQLNPYWELFDKDGNMIKTFGVNDKVTGEVRNPYYVSQIKSKDESRYTSIRNSTNMEWRPVKEFKLGFRFGISQQVSETDKFKSPNHPDYEKEEDIRKKGQYNYSNTKSTNWNVAANLSFAKVIRGHSIFLGADVNMQENRSVNYGMGVIGFTLDKLDFITMGSQYSGDVPSGRESTTRSAGMMANVSYNYNSMIFLDASIRLDGASSFGDQGRYKPYYSVGAGWTISRLKFFQERCPWMSTWRIRYNYGVSGSLQYGQPYEAMTVYEYDIARRYTGLIGTTIMGYGNPDLSWQYTYSHNVGTDLGFWKGRISVGFNFYRKKTEGLSTTMNLPLSHGYSSYKENKGDVENLGLDANVSITAVRKNNFSWSFRASVAHNRNKILKLSKAMKEMSARAEIYGLADPNYLYREGESMDALYVVPSLGIDPNTGKEIYLDQRGNPTYRWQSFNRKSYGVKQPKANARLSTSLRYKGLSVTASFGMRLGGKIYNSTLATKVEQANLKFNVDRRVFTERWQKPGDHSKYQALNPEKSSSNQSSRFVQAERTFQFNSLNINYNFGKKLLKYLHLKGGSFSASMGDLFYLSTVERERGTSYPFSYKPTFSLTLTF